MSSAVERLKKRRPRQLNGFEGVFARSLTLGESQKSDTFKKEANGALGIDGIRYILATCLVDENGEPVYSGPDDSNIDDMPTDTLKEVVEEIVKQSNAGKPAAIEKN